MFKCGIVILLTTFVVAVFANPTLEDRTEDHQAKEYQKVIDLNYKFQKADLKNLCQKAELPSECFQRKLSEMHSDEKLSVQGLMAAVPAGKGLIVNEKNKAQKTKSKLSNSELSLASHKKQSEFAIFLLKLSCTAAPSKDAQNALKTLKKVAHESIEQVRKYSEPESVALQMKLDTTLLCEKK
ncbi:hypothetical protein CIK05_13090 [Bdellovibrio sp. qaytius]|nr:hypothetical protein CIK05_13090 [Bdellovibrio sp. qaytius]